MEGYITTLAYTVQAVSDLVLLDWDQNILQMACPETNVFYIQVHSHSTILTVNKGRKRRPRKCKLFSRFISHRKQRMELQE